MIRQPLMQQAHLDQVVDAGLDLHHVEGLAHEILGASLQRAQFVPGLRGDHQHRDVVVDRVGLERLHHLEAVHARHLQVEHDQVVGVPAVQAGDGPGVHGGGHIRVAGTLEHFFEQQDVGLLVVNDQDAGIEDVLCGDGHGMSSARSWPCVAAASANAASNASMSWLTLMGLVM
ncbi:hypothetical protein D9M68_684790 [compost metagenome]